MTEAAIMKSVRFAAEVVWRLIFTFYQIEMDEHEFDVHRKSTSRNGDVNSTSELVQKMYSITLVFESDQ